MHNPATLALRKYSLLILTLALLVVGAAIFANPFLQNKQHDVAPIDAGFARSMMLHHAQAIQMAMMMKGDVSPEVQALAQSIILKQTREMGVMEGWLTAWNEAVMVAGAPMAWVEDAAHVQHLDDQLFQARCKTDGGAMAGVATAEQLAQLENAKGTAKEILFFELMLAHHQAAIPMAWFAKRNGDSKLVKGLASTMIRDQTTEIGWMQMKLQQIQKS